MKSLGRGGTERRILSESPAPAARGRYNGGRITEPRMRFLSWKTACAAALSAPLLALAQQPSDYAREKRWADEVVPSIVVGEPVWLEAPRTEKFLGIYTEAKNAKGAIVLAHGLGVHPDYGLIGDLRRLLSDAGYTTLSIQMPILAADAPAARYPVLFWEADARFAGAVSYLWRKGQRKVVLLSHSMGSRMANHYISSHPQVPLAGWISLSISSGEFAPLKRVNSSAEQDSCRRGVGASRWMDNPGGGTHDEIQVYGRDGGACGGCARRVRPGCADRIARLAPVPRRTGRRARRDGADHRARRQSGGGGPGSAGLSGRVALQAERAVERARQRPARPLVLPARLREREGARLLRA